MKGYRRWPKTKTPGHTITVAAPTGGVLSGNGVLIGTLFGIAQYDAVEGADVES